MPAVTSVARPPNLFLVGAPKCGTTSLWTWLGQHPDIYMSPEKEPSFFSRSLDDPQQRWRSDEYDDLFRGARDERWVGEATVSYLRAPGAADRIRSFAQAVQRVSEARARFRHHVLRTTSRPARCRPTSSGTYVCSERMPSISSPSTT